MELDTAKLKIVQLELLKNFIQVCSKHNLQYYMVGGSCLGAVRHKGFIPWDDDIDVGMPRKDYEQFLKIAQNELAQNVFVQTFETDRQFPMNFAKLRDSNTTFVETGLKNLNINHGVYIDIFPLDSAPAGRIALNIHFIRKKLYDLRITKAYYLKRYDKTDKEYYSMANIVKRTATAFSCLLSPDLNRTVQKRQLLYKKYNGKNTGLIANYGGAWEKREVMPLAYFGKGSKGVFEGTEVILPQDYDAYLTSLYGDYMTPPPPEKRIGHHYCEVIDTERSYIHYV